MQVVNTGFTSVYFNSICLTIAAFVFIVLVIFMYFKKEKVNGLTTHLFIMCLVLNLTCILLEFIVPLCIKEILNNDNASTIYYIICKSYLIIALLWDSVYLLYTFVKIQNLKFFYNEETNRYNKYAILVFGILLIFSISFVLIFNVEYRGGVNKVPYTIGGQLKLLFDIFTIVGSTYIIIAFARYSFKIKNINMFQFYFVFIFYLCILSLEYFSDFTFNHLSFVQSLIILTTYFTIESQDNQLINDYNRIKEENEAASKVKSNFLINMSHEIRTPMNTIIGLGEMLINENNLSEESFKNDFKNITSASYSLLSLIDNISYISKLDSGKVEVVNNDYNLKDLVREIFDNNVTVKAKEKGIIFDLSISNALPNLFEGDSRKIYEILYGILSNLVDSINEEKIKLVINGTKKDNNKMDMEYIIEYTGNYINLESFNGNSDNVLEMNRNLVGNSNYNSNMTFLIIRLLVRLMNGKIELNHDVVNETKYILKLEQNIKDSTPIGDVLLSNILIQTETKTIIDCSGKNVLFVDSNDAIIRMASNYLEQYHFNVSISKSADDFLNNFKSNKYDILFIDYTMICSSGRTIMDELIALGIPLPKMVALISNNTISQTEYDKGYDAYINKPIVLNELNSIINKFFTNGTGGDNK